jgi:hypothetical protein
MFSGITSYLFGGSNDATQNEVSESNANRMVGTLYMLNRKTNEYNCHFLEASAKFQQKGRFLCDLCIERLEEVPDEGDEVFILELISGQMNAHLQKGPDTPHGVAWTTPRGDFLLEFESSEEALAMMFEFARHVYEDHFQREPANDEAIHKFMQDLQKKPLTPHVQAYTPPSSKTVSKTQSPVNNSPFKESKTQSPVASPYKITPKKPTASPPRFNVQKSVVIDGVVGTEVKSETGIFTVRSGNQQIVVGTDITISIVTNEQEGFVCLRNKGEIIHCWPINVDVSLRYDTNTRSMVWVADMGEDMGDGLFEFAFSTFKSFSEFQKEIVSRTYAAKNKSKVTADDLDWMMDGLSSKIVQMSIDDAKDEEDEEDIIPEEKPSPFKSQHNTPLKTKTTDSPSFINTQKGKNSLLSVGRCQDRTYVVRGSNVGVFSPQKRGLKYESTFNVESPNKKIPFSPSKSMLHKADEKLLLLHPEETKKIYCMDLERGKVVEEWDTDGYKLNAILPESKDSQSQGSDCFVGVNNNGFFIVDPRSNKKVVRTHQYTNSATTHFKCGATTGDGDLVVGTGLGEIRLFSHDTMAKGGEAIGVAAAPRAKTKLVGYGDPILAVDSTRDGKFVLATCESYLILCPVADEAGKHTGFKKSVKRSPILLRLTPEDVVTVGGKVNFTAAKFNVVGEETLIVTSTANWVIIWNFEDLVHSDGDGPVNIKYTKRWYPDNVVADDFTRNSEGEIVLTMPDDVRVYQCKK